MISSCLELLLIIITWWSYKLILNILWFVLNLFFYTGKILSLPVSSKCIERYIKIFFCGSTTRKLRAWNKRKCIELEREKMSDDLIKLNNAELNYTYLKRIQMALVTIRMKNLCYKKSLFNFKQLSIVRTSEGVSIRYILYWKHILYFQMLYFFLDWNVCFKFMKL